MPQYEYKVIPAPQRAEKAKGVKGVDARFARTIETVMNDMARDGWEFQRAELLPNEERSGLTGTTTTWRNLLVFRRVMATDMEAVVDAPVAETPDTPAPIAMPQADAEPALIAESEPSDPKPRPTLRAVPDPDTPADPPVTRDPEER